MKSYVITGGPSVGKTTVIEILASRGYTIVPEAARVIIEEEQLKGSDALPWKDVKSFQEKVVKKQLRQENEIQDEIAFLDRGIVDGYAYSVLADVGWPAEIEKFGHDRYEKVFILEPTGIHIQDSARKEDEGSGLRIHEAIRDAYKYFGYDPISVPLLPPEKRVDFILNNIKS